MSHFITRILRSGQLEKLNGLFLTSLISIITLFDFLGHKPHAPIIQLPFRDWWKCYATILIKYTTKYSYLIQLKYLVTWAILLMNWGIQRKVWNYLSTYIVLATANLNRQLTKEVIQVAYRRVRGVNEIFIIILKGRKRNKQQTKTTKQWFGKPEVVRWWGQKLNFL